MHLAAFLTSLPLAFAPALRQLARLGFTHADLVALAERAPADREALAESGLIVSCAALGRALPEGCTLDAPDLAARQQAVALVKSQITDAAQLGATWAYLVPGMEAGAA